MEEDSRKNSNMASDQRRLGNVVVEMQFTGFNFAQTIKGPRSAGKGG